MLKAKDIMTSSVKAVSADTNIEELASLFEEWGVNAMPVLDAEGRLEGIVTQTDLVEQDRPLHIPTVVSLFDWVFYLQSEKDFQKEVEKITARKASEIMSREVATCDPDTPVSDIAEMMAEKAVHLVPVVENDRVVGVVARLDIIRSMKS